MYFSILANAVVCMASLSVIINSEDVLDEWRKKKYFYTSS